MGWHCPVQFHCWNFSYFLWSVKWGNSLGPQSNWLNLTFDQEVEICCKQWTVSFACYSGERWKGQRGSLRANLLANWHKEFTAHFLYRGQDAKGSNRVETWQNNWTQFMHAQLLNENTFSTFRKRHVTFVGDIRTHLVRGGWRRTGRVGAVQSADDAQMMQASLSCSCLHTQPGSRFVLVHMCCAAPGTRTQRRTRSLRNEWCACIVWPDWSQERCGWASRISAVALRWGVEVWIALQGLQGRRVWFHWSDQHREQ